LDAAAISAPVRPTPISSLYATPAQNSAADWATLLIAAWTLGVVILMARLGGQLLSIWGLTRVGEDVAFDPALGLPPHTRVMRTAAIQVPMTLGFVRPTILLPAEFKGWSEERVRAVLLHESAHVRRGDWAWMIFGRVMGAVYWPNLLVFLAASRMRAEAEVAADDAVLSAGVDAPNYAATLVDLAERLRGRPMAAGLAFVEPGSLKGRIASILRRSARRAPLGKAAALGMLVAMIAAAMPFASAHLVPGAARAEDGVLRFEDGSSAEIVAITRMKGGKATSWAMNGALLRHPLPVNEKDWDWLSTVKPVPAGATVRYAIVRLSRGDGWAPTFETASGEGLNPMPYDDPDLPEGAFQDALGGQYRVLRLVLPRGARTASLVTKFGAGSWRLFAFNQYQNGDVTGSLNPGADLRIAPQMAKFGRGTVASFNLPAPDSEGDEREFTARFYPGGTDRGLFEGYGAQTTTSEVRPEAVTRVELLSRRLQKVVIPGIPLEPDPKAVYVPRHYLPAIGVEAVKGRAKFSDGGVLRIERVSTLQDHLFRSWDSEGNYQVVAPQFKLRGPNSFHYDSSRTSGATQIQLSYRPALSRNIENSVVYDGEGWPIFRYWQTYFTEDATDTMADGVVDPSLRRSDLVGSFAVGPNREIARFDRVAAKTTWSFSSRKDWQGVLRVTFPAGIGKGMSLEAKALDDRDKPVVSSQFSGPSYQRSDGWVEFNLKAHDAGRVQSVQILGRPYTWVRFPSVALQPPMVSVRK
jgi:hypothetical protein